jgi:hypothetical protein
MLIFNWLKIEHKITTYGSEDPTIEALMETPVFFFDQLNTCKVYTQFMVNQLLDWGSSLQTG